MSKTALQTSLRLLLDAWDNTVDIGQCKTVRNSSPLALIRVVAKNLVRCISEKNKFCSAGAARGELTIAFAQMCTHWYHVIKLTSISGNGISAACAYAYCTLTIFSYFNFSFTRGMVFNHPHPIRHQRRCLSRAPCWLFSGIKLASCSFVWLPSRDGLYRTTTTRQIALIGSKTHGPLQSHKMHVGRYMRMRTTAGHGRQWMLYHNITPVPA